MKENELLIQNTLKLLNKNSDTHRTSHVFTEKGFSDNDVKLVIDLLSDECLIENVRYCVDGSYSFELVR